VTAELVEVAEALTTVVTELQDINTIQSHNLLVSYPDPAPPFAVEGPPAGRARAASRPCAGQVCWPAVQLRGSASRS
jgi:hypothetical protein